MAVRAEPLSSLNGETRTQSEEMNDQTANRMNASNVATPCFKMVDKGKSRAFMPPDYSDPYNG